MTDEEHVARALLGTLHLLVAGLAAQELGPMGIMLICINAIDAAQERLGLDPRTASQVDRLKEEAGRLVTRD